MVKVPRSVAIAGACLALAAFGTTGVAIAEGSSSPPSQSDSQDGQENEGNEGAADQAAQDAACTAAGIPLTATNINYDDETGVCTLGGSDDDGDGESNDGAGVDDGDEG